MVPNGYGEQNLYKVCVNLFKKTEHGLEEIDYMERRIGIRTMTMSRDKNAWGEEFAQTVNGVKIFANFNSIRVGGGGYYPEDWFYDLCDEMEMFTK